MNREKTARNEKIIRFYEKHPDWSYAAIARMLHVRGDKGYHSRQIVRQVIVRHLKVEGTGHSPQVFSLKG